MNQKTLVYFEWNYSLELTNAYYLEKLIRDNIILSLGHLDKQLLICQSVFTQIFKHKDIAFESVAVSSAN